MTTENTTTTTEPGIITEQPGITAVPPVAPVVVPSSTPDPSTVAPGGLEIGDMEKGLRAKALALVAKIRGSHQVMARLLLADYVETVGDLMKIWEVTNRAFTNKQASELWNGAQTLEDGPGTESWVLTYGDEGETSLVLNDAELYKKNPRQAGTIAPSTAHRSQGRILKFLADCQAKLTHSLESKVRTKQFFPGCGIVAQQNLGSAVFMKLPPATLAYIEHGLVNVAGKSYSSPSAALRDGRTVMAVFQAYKLAAIPRIDDHRRYGVRKDLFDLSRMDAAKTQTLVRIWDTDQRRWQKKNVSVAVSDDVLHGHIVGALTVAMTTDPKAGKVEPVLLNTQQIQDIVDLLGRMKNRHEEIARARANRATTPTPAPEPVPDTPVPSNNDAAAALLTDLKAQVQADLAEVEAAEEAEEAAAQQ